MTSEQRKFTTELLLLGSLGVLLLAVVYGTPDAGQRNGSSFFDVARQTRWQATCDLPAAWCSAKIILLSMGFFFTAMAGCRVLKLWLPEGVNSVLLPLILVPAAGFWAGLFFLLRALL